MLSDSGPVNQEGRPLNSPFTSKTPEDILNLPQVSTEDREHSSGGQNGQKGTGHNACESRLQNETLYHDELHLNGGGPNGTQPAEPITDSPYISISAGATLTADDEIWSRNLHQMNNTSLEGASALESTISPSASFSTTQSSPPARKRVKFSGETLAHSMLPVMNGHAELSAGVSSQAAPRVDRTVLRVQRAPKSSHPYGKAPWIRADCQAHLDLLGHLPPEDRHYLYNMKGVFNFPQRSVSDQLVRVFFEFIYPLFPIFDRRDTVMKYDRLYNQQESSPLLFHSLLFSACQYADDQLLSDAGFINVLEARTYFFQRAKMLYSCDYEPDHTVVVQSLILLSFWWMDYIEEKDIRYWISCAANLALSMGMHKTLPESLDMSNAHRRLWRRIFWTLYVSHYSSPWYHAAVNPFLEP